MSVIPLQTIIGNYRIEDLIGAGGMGDVYRAVRLRDQNIFAIKILRRTSDFDETAVARFRNEAIIQYNLRHPHVAALIEYMEYEGRPCLVMEYVGGPSIRDLVRLHGPMNSQEALRHFIPVCDALAFVHSKKIVHRDIKADNIRLTFNGEPKLLDFGIALAKQTPKMTRDGFIVGTRASLAPEQLKGLKGDARSDVWAMGVLLYEMVTGKLPFVAETEATLIHKIMGGKHLRPSQVDCRVPPLIDSLVAKCLAMKLEDRFASGAVLLAESRRALARLQSTWSFFWNVRIPRWAYIAILLCGLAGVGFFAYTRQATTEQSATEQRATEQSATEQRAMSDFLPKQESIIEASDGRAEVLLNGEPVGYTPYRASAPAGEVLQFTLRRPGHQDRIVHVKIGEQKIYSFDLRKNSNGER
jgi:serine/threonine-protein kinase